MKIIVNGIEGQSQFELTEEKKPCGCEDEKGTYLCGYCGNGVRHPNNTICWKKATSGKGTRIKTESHPRTTGFKGIGKWLIATIKQSSIIN